MGGLNEPASNNGQLKVEQLLENLELYEETHSEQFGPVKVYKQATKPFKYIMLYIENGIDDRTTVMKMQEKLKWYKSLRSHPNIVEIEGVRMLESTTEDM